MISKFWIKQLCALSVICFLAVPALAKDSTAVLAAQEKGLNIAKAADKADGGFDNYQVNLIMTLKNQHGQISTRYIRLRILETPDDGDKSFSVFDRPRDVKGTALLTFSHKEGPDDQWLYLPALKRVKRISSTNKSGAFMGSEFSFEDLGSQEIEKYTHKYLRDEIVNSRNVVVVERVPVYTYSGYSKQEVWWDAQDYRLYKIDYFDRKGELLKTQTVPNHQLFLKRWWRPLEVIMVNHQTGKSTELVWENYEFKVGLTDQDFTQNALKRAN